MINRLKYWLLRKLLRDICIKSDCTYCCHNPGEKAMLPFDCTQEDCYTQAEKVWGIKDMGIPF